MLRSARPARAWNLQTLGPSCQGRRSDRGFSNDPPASVTAYRWSLYVSSHTAKACRRSQGHRPPLLTENCRTASRDPIALYSPPHFSTWRQLRSCLLAPSSSAPAHQIQIRQLTSCSLSWTPPSRSFSSSPFVRSSQTPPLDLDEFDFPPPPGADASSITAEYESFPSSLVGNESDEVEDGDSKLFEATEMSQLFRILASPVRSPVATTSSPLMASKLDPDYLAHLKSSVLNSSRQTEKELTDLELDAAVVQTKMSRILASKQQRRARKGGSLALVEEEGESAVSMEDILRVIDVNSLLRRPKEAQKAFDMIKTATGVNPGLEAYNGLMDAYANVGDIKNAAQIFQRIRISKSMQPDVVSFSILIKACVTGLDLAGAFKVYNNMKQRGIAPNLPIYTTLIKGCIKSDDLPRAWKTFDHLRTEVVEPDSVVYTLMLHACARAGEAERALSLFKEMLERGWVPSDVTYNSLIQACGSRPDYYHEAWSLVEQMRRDGFAPSRWTFNVLLGVAATGHDLVRARKIWNEMQEVAGLVPDYFSFQKMFKALSSARQANRTIRKDLHFARRMGRQIPAMKPDSEDDLHLVTGGTTSVFDDLDMSTESGSSDSARPKGPPTDSQIAKLGAPMLLFDCKDPSFHAAVLDADRLKDYLVTLHYFFEDKGTSSSATEGSTQADLPPHFGYLNPSLIPRVNSSIVDTYLHTLCQFRAPMTFKAINVFDTHYEDDPDELPEFKTNIVPTLGTQKPSNDPAALLVSSSQQLADNPPPPAAAPNSTNLTASRPMPKVLRTGKTFRLALGTVCRDKMALRSDADRIWQKFLAWDTLMESRFGKKKKTEEEREALRMMEGRGRKSVATSFINMINGMARLDKISEALRLLERTRSFRYPFYLPQVFYRDIEVLVEKIRELSEAGNVKPLRKLQALCPPATALPTEAVGSGDRLIEVQKALRLKSIGKKWWGWEAIGVDQRQQALERRRITKEKERIQQYWDSKRK